MLALVVLASCMIARLWSPYDVSTSRNLLMLAGTLFPIFLVVYVFLRNNLRSHLDSVEQEISEIAKDWRDERHDFAKKAIEGYGREYTLPFFLIISAELLLFISILLSMYTVFIGICCWVEVMALGLIIAALILFMIMLLFHHGYPGPESLFSNLNSYLESIKQEHEAKKSSLNEKNKPQRTGDTG
jgi:hypothetical protein